MCMLRCTLSKSSAYSISHQDVFHSKAIRQSLYDICYAIVQQGSLATDVVISDNWQ